MKNHNTKKVLQFILKIVIFYILFFNINNIFEANLNIKILKYKSAGMMLFTKIGF